MTLKELAKIASVSISTVSKALNGSPEIGEDTKRRINDLAKLYNYQPNHIAVNLKTGKTKTIGVIVPSIQNNFFARVIVGIEEVLNANNYNIIISITKESKQKEAEIMTALSNGVVDGFLIAMSEETQVSQDINHFHDVSHRKKPIVLFDRVIKSLDYDKIIVDDNAVISKLVTELQDKGKKAIALVSSVYNLSVGKSRKQGYLEAISAKQNPILIEANVDDLYEQLNNSLKTQTIDAIIALDEDSAMLALKAIKSNNMKLPQDISLLGYAPRKLAENVSPQLSTVNQHGMNIGKTAAHRLIEKLENPKLAAECIVINSTIDYRETT